MEPLSDPLSDRVVKTLPPPPHRPIPHEALFPAASQVPDWRLLQSYLHREGRVTKQDCLELLTRVYEVMKFEPNVVELNEPAAIVGDIHGQYYDFEQMLALCGPPEDIGYLFLGDYVDRGSFSVEVVLLLFALKLAHPTSIYMLRGNHECRQMTSFFNFRTECLAKYDLEVYERVMECFDALPLACLLSGRYFAVHGGLSPDMKVVSDISVLNRFQEPLRKGLVCDLLWSDPANGPEATELYAANGVRGCSFVFSAQASSKFLKKNHLLTIFRGHEAQLDGYKMHNWDDTTFPTVITVFSAPNYCDVYHNKGAIVKIIDGDLTIHQLEETPHPYVLPNNMDIFSWSVPFMAEKVVEILMSMLKSRTGRSSAIPHPESRVKELKETVTETKKEHIRKKIKSIGKIMKLFKILREENELVVQLKGVCPGHKIPFGLLREGRNAMQTALQDFNLAKQWDLVNEKRPD